MDSAAIRSANHTFVERLRLKFRRPASFRRRIWSARSRGWRPMEARTLSLARKRGAQANGRTVQVDVEIGDEDGVQKETIEARCVVNAAGLYADEVAAMLGNKTWTIYPVRGEYCEIRGPRASLINSLVYPLPHAHGLSLGVHFTKTLWGTVLVGPSAAYVEGKDNYERDRLAIKAFAQSARQFCPR